MDEEFLTVDMGCSSVQTKTAHRLNCFIVLSVQLYYKFELCKKKGIKTVVFYRNKTFFHNNILLGFNSI